MNKLLTACAAWLGLSASLMAYTPVEDALLGTTQYSLSGTFGQHDFADADSPFDWAFTLPNGQSYQLQGNEPSATDVFGWKAVDIPVPDPVWYMAYIGDWDGDGDSKFDWVLFYTDSANKMAYKLAGVSPTGTFEYEGPLDIDYMIADGVISTGAPGTFGAGDGEATLSFDQDDNQFKNLGDTAVTIYNMVIEFEGQFDISAQGYSQSIAFSGTYDYNAGTGTVTANGITQAFELPDGVETGDIFPATVPAGEFMDIETMSYEDVIPAGVAATGYINYVYHFDTSAGEITATASLTF